MSLNSQKTIHPAPQSSMEFIALWRMIAQRKWHIFLLALLFGLLALAISLSTPPVYRSTAVMLIESSKPKVISSIEDVYAGATANTEFFNTQAEILKSREVTLAAIQKLKLWDHPGLDPRKSKPRVYQPLLDLMGFSATPAPEWNEELLSAAVYGKISNDINIEVVRLSQLVRVSFESTDKTLAAAVPNALIEAFIDSDREARFKMTQQANTWLHERLKTLRATLEDSESRLQKYREKEGMISLTSSAQGGAAKMIEAVTQKLIEARLKTAEAKNNFDQIKNAKTADLMSQPQVMSNVVVLDANRQLLDAERKHAELAQRYGPEHPKMIQATGELNVAKEQVSRALQMVVSRAQSEYQVALATERSLESSLEQAKSGVLNLNKKEFALEVLTREVDTNKQLYETFMNRAKETNVAQDLQSSIGRLIDAAQTPSSPIKPKKALNVVLAVFLGILLAIGGILLRALLDNTVKGSNEIENQLHLGMLSSLPEMNKAMRQHAGMAVHYEPHSLYAEAIRTARTGIMLSALDDDTRVLLVTSSLPGEGKTTFATNLALTHAQTQKTLLIDADMRKPSAASKLELNPMHAGLSDLVAGQADLNGVVQTIADSSLHFISAGTLPPNPQELLHSKRFADTLDQLKTQYDVIVIDSPPIELVSDALLLAMHSSSVIYLVRANETPIPVIRKGLNKLMQVDAPILGIALNCVDTRKAETAQYGYGHTPYGYGHNMESKKA